MDDFRFIFLGTGTSGGIPIIACDCPACTSDDPRDTRLRTGAAVRWTDPAGDGRLLLIDATPDLRQQALRHDLRRCDGIFFTHHHVDHIFGLDEVRRFNAVMREPIPVWAEPRTMENLVRVYAHIFNRDANLNASFVATLEPRRLDEGRPVDLHGLRVTPIRVLHGKMPITGFRIEAAPDAWPEGADPSAGGVLPLAYCTDTSAIPTETWSRLTGLGTLVLDGLRHRKHPTHFSLDEACTVAGRVGAPRTFLIHIAHEVVHAEVDPSLPEGVALAHDDLELGPGAGR